MLLPLQEHGLSLGLTAWLAGSSTPLAVAAHPSGVLLALARGSVLTVLPLLRAPASPEQQAQLQAVAATCPIHHAAHQYTALAWFVHLKPSRALLQSGRSTPSPQQQQQQQQHQQQGLFQQPQQQRSWANTPDTHHRQEAAQSASSQQQQIPAAAGSAGSKQQLGTQQHPHPQDDQQQLLQRLEQQQQQQQQQQLPRCSQQVVESLLESEVLLSGTADGHLQIHTASGQLLFKQRLMASPVLDILVRPHCSGLRSSDASEEVCVTFSNALVRINTLDLRSQVRMLQLVQGGGAAVAASIQPLPHIRYELPAAVGPRISGICFGPLPADLYSLLSAAASSSGSSRPGKHKVCIVTVGRAPCLAAFEAEERPSRSTLAALVGMASSLTSGVVGAASKAAGLGPSVVYSGVKSLMRPLSSWYSSSSSSSTIPSSLLQPAVAFEDLQQLPKPEALSLTKQLRDDDRVLEGLVPAPAGALLVSPDNLGRVVLLEGASMAAVRIWKGYRDAQCGWLLPPPSHPASPLGLLLVLYAPKRQVLEVWLPRSGQKLASRTVDYPCLLVTVGLPCGGWGNGQVWQAWQEQVGSATTLVMNVQSGEVWDAMDCLVE